MTLRTLRLNREARVAALQGQSGLEQVTAKIVHRATACDGFARW